MEHVNITVIGSGVIGLAIACELSKKQNDIIIVEKNASFGCETSSRNSEVIHAGIYYPKDSLKTTTCIEGRRLLYEFSAENNIGYKRIGKLIVATNKNEIFDLESLFQKGRDNGVKDLRLITPAELHELEPNIKAEAAIFSPSTGIINSHAFMESLIMQFKARQGSISYGTEFVGLEKKAFGFLVKVKDRDAENFSFLSDVVINCAGLDSDKVALNCGVHDDGYKIKYCKGNYFRVNSLKSALVKHLVYPVPRKQGAGLGVHVTLDLSGGMRLGPDDRYVDKVDYEVDKDKKNVFYADAVKFLPFLSLKDLSEDIAGVRPKLQGPGESFRDFIIKEESQKGLPGLINLIGIESPGLTASLAIARVVLAML